MYRERDIDCAVGAGGGRFPSSILAYDLIPKGLTVLEDVPPSLIDVRRLKPQSFLRGEATVTGEEMRRRAVRLGGNLGLADGKHLLQESDKIPLEFRDFYIPLPGTLLCDDAGHCGIQCLVFGVNNSWCLRFRWLDYGWFGYGWGGLNCWRGQGVFACGGQTVHHPRSFGSQPSFGLIIP